MQFHTYLTARYYPHMQKGTIPSFLLTAAAAPLLLGGWEATIHGLDALLSWCFVDVDLMLILWMEEILHQLISW